MKSFRLAFEQMVALVAALAADELARGFGRYTETLTLSRWNGETRLGRGGVDATPEQQTAIAARVAHFLGLEASSLPVAPGDCIRDWAERAQAAVARGLRAFNFHPTTAGPAVNASHPADEIFEDAAAVASLMQGRRRVVSMVSSHSLLGLVSTVIAPNLLRLPVIDGRTLTPDELGDRLAFGDIVVATPTLWRYLADTLPGMANNIMGLSFGERLGVDLAGRLRQRGLGAMRELYGSTETGVVAWRDSPPDQFVLFAHWQREGDGLVRIRPDGVRRPAPAMDDLQWRSARGFDLGRRRDGAVQIGAVNVFPAAIAASIAAHPDVARCEVRVSQRAGALDRLIAEIDLLPERIADVAMAWSIDEWCRQRLRPTERPRIYTFRGAEGLTLPDDA